MKNTKITAVCNVCGKAHKVFSGSKLLKKAVYICKQCRKRSPK